MVTKKYIDQYTKIARKKNLRSRSWFKIQSIDECDSLFSDGMMVVDLGSSPGGWSYYVSKKIGYTGMIIACDIRPMRQINQVKFLQGDFSDINIVKRLLKRIGDRKVQIVLSDMSPNMSGISIVDMNKSIFLGNIALDFCRKVLEDRGMFLVKIFQGQGFDQYLYDVQSLFNMVKVRKPNASRSYSREVYIVAKECKIHR